MKKADFNIDGYEVFEDENKFAFENKISAKTRHNFSGKNVFFDINSESIGTQTIFMLLPVLRDVIVNEKILVFDELDRSLHPYIVKYIVNMFNSSLNKGAQLIFNTHDTNLLDLSILRKDQIRFTEKDPDTGESILYPLDDFDDKSVKDIEIRYLLGRYGAVPYIEDIDNYE